LICAKVSADVVSTFTVTSLQIVTDSAQ